MAQQPERVGVPIGDDGDRRVRFQRAVEVPDLAVDPGRERSPGQTGADALGDLPGCGACGRLAPAAVWERHLNHGHRGDS